MIVYKLATRSFRSSKVLISGSPCLKGIVGGHLVAWHKQSQRLFSTTSDRKQSIPVVDIGEIGIAHKQDPSEDKWQRVGKELNDALTTFGCVYLRNHGISDNVVNNVFKASEDFFNLPMEEKEKWPRDMTTFHGYAPPGRELLDPSLPLELKESYDLRSSDDFFPDEEVPSFRPASEAILEESWSLSKRLIAAFAYGLGLQPEVLVDAHKHVGKEGNHTIARLLNYPPVPEDTQKDAVRCGIHADYGTLTLLFQDDMGGLKVRNTQGEFIDAKNIPGTVFLFIGELMELWTSRRWIAAEHQVVVPEEEIRKRQRRRSMAYFVMPDTDVLIKPLDGSDQFEPVRIADLIKKKVEATHTY